MENKNNKLHLAVDIHHLFLENAGTKRVTENIVEELKKDQNITLSLLSPTYSIKRGHRKLQKMWGHVVRFFWVHLHLPILCALKKVDVLFSPEFNTPFFTTCKRTVMAHDAHIRAQKEYVSSIWFHFYYVPFIEKAIRRSDLIFTVSEFAKRQVVELMKLDPQKVHIAYNGLDKIFVEFQETSDVKRDILARFDLEDKKYILFVGTFEARKNIERLIKAFAEIKSRNLAELEGVKLAIVGSKSSGRFSDRSESIDKLITMLNLNEHIVICGYVQDSELPYIYRSCRLLAFPSLQEGFGLPIIEAYSSGVPVLTSNICSMPEIAGDGAALVNPYNVNEIADMLIRIICDDIFSKGLISVGNNVVENFTWKRCVSQIMSQIRLLT